MVVLRFVLSLTGRMNGETGPIRSCAIRGILGTNVPSSYGVEEYVRAKVEKQEGSLVVMPIFAKSSVISTLSKADGFFVIPEGAEGLEAGVEVEVYPLA
jgi:molybdopterin molybdotransferase